MAPWKRCKGNKIPGKRCGGQSPWAGTRVALSGPKSRAKRPEGAVGAGPIGERAPASLSTEVQKQALWGENLPLEAPGCSEYRWEFSTSPDTQTWGLGDSAVGRTLAWHAAGPDSVPATIFDFLSMATPEVRARTNSVLTPQNMPLRLLEEQISCKVKKELEIIIPQRLREVQGRLGLTQPRRTQATLELCPCLACKHCRGTGRRDLLAFPLLFHWPLCCAPSPHSNPTGKGRGCPI